MTLFGKSIVDLLIVLISMVAMIAAPLAVLAILWWLTPRQGKRAFWIIAIACGIVALAFWYALLQRYRGSYFPSEADIELIAGAAWLFVTTLVWTAYHGFRIYRKKENSIRFEVRP